MPPLFGASRKIGARRLALALTLVAALLPGILSLPQAAAAEDPVLVGAGDIASCEFPDDTATGNLLDGIPGTVFTLGDNAYEDGTAAQYANCYEPTWGRHKGRTRPVAGNHDYHSSGAAPYYNYFGAAAGPPGLGYYSYNLAGWHVIVLNSNCPDVSCGAGSPQLAWLRADLAAHPAECTVAMWHHPRFSSGSVRGSDTRTALFWDTLYAAGVDLILNGHSHTYERFAPQTPAGVSDPAFGIREIIAGTGGRSTHAFAAVVPNSEARARAFGLLKLTLHPSSYSWQFVPTPGQVFTDSGTSNCHGAPTSPPPPPPPPPPVGPTASFVAAADARTDQATPTTNFGSASRLRIDGSPRSESYLRFDVAGLTGSVTRARLRLTVADGSSNGAEVYGTTSNWSEGSINWNNRPPRTTGLVADAGGVSAGQVIELDVTPLVTGNGSVSFKLDPDSSDAMETNSREAGSGRPELIVTTTGVAPQLPLFPTPSVIRSVYNPAHCIDVKHNDPADGNGLWGWPCDANTAQLWSLDPTGSVNGEPAYLLRRTALPGKCLDVPASQSNDGLRLVQWACHGGNNQRWVIRRPGGLGTVDRPVNFQLVSVATGKCIDLDIAAPGGGFSNGTPLQQWSCLGANQRNQLWNFG